MKTKAYSETELVSRARIGLDAFGELVERYRGSIQRQCFSRVKDRDHAEDLAQETFIRAYLKLDQLQEPSLFPNWLRRIASNTCSEFLRSRQRREHSWEEIPEVAASTVPAGGDLAEHLSQLPDETRFCVELYYREQLSYSEIAELTGTTEGTVRNRLHRAKAFLREEMADLADNGTSAFTKRVIQKLEELQSRDPKDRSEASDALRRSLEDDHCRFILNILMCRAPHWDSGYIDWEKAMDIGGAIKASKRYRSPEMRDALIDLMLNHDYEEIRMKAAGALVAQKDPSAIPYLRQAMENPRNPREVVSAAKSTIAQLQNIPSAPIPDFENQRLRKDIQYAAADKTARLELVNRLKTALGDTSSKVRTDAAKALGELGDKRAVPALIKALEDADASVRIVATKALGKLKSRRAIPALLNAARLNRSCLAGSALAEIGATDALPSLLEIEREKGDSGSMSIMALVPYGILNKLTTPENLPEVKRVIKSMAGKLPDHAIEWALMAALAKSENPDDVPEITALIERPATHSNKPLVAELQAALGRIGTDQALAALRRYLQQGSIPAGHALVSFGEKGLEALKDAMRSENQGAQEAAMEGLFFAGGYKLAASDNEAVDILKHIAETGSRPKLRMYAKGILRRMKRNVG